MPEDPQRTSAPVDRPVASPAAVMAGRWPWVRRVVLAAGLAAVLGLGAVGAADGPGSCATFGALLLAFVFAAVALSRVAGLLLRLLSGVGALVSAMVLGVLLVNSYYSYYQSWGALWADVRADNGVSAAPVLIPVVRPGVGGGSLGLSGPGRGGGRGRLLSLSMPGTVSGVYGRDALVWLPPQYDDPQYRTRRFPVLELLHGDPGGPRSWTNGLQLLAVLDRVYAAGTSPPMVVVMPDVNGGFHGQQCLNAVAGPKLDTYLTNDIPAGLADQVRVFPPGRRWAVGGLSEGAFCAARLALRDPTAFGGVAVMDGYFHPNVTGDLRRRLYGVRGVPARDDPTAMLRAIRPGSPLPAFWIMAGTGNAQDYHAAISFATVLGRREDLRFLTVVGGKHTTPSWRAALPDLLRWSADVVNGHPVYGQSSVHV